MWREPNNTGIIVFAKVQERFRVHCQVNQGPLVTHYNDVTWASWRFLSSAIWLFVQQLIQTNIKENISAPPNWTCERGIHRSPHKGPVMRKMFLFQGVIKWWSFVVGWGWGWGSRSPGICLYIYPIALKFGRSFDSKTVDKSVKLRRGTII